MESKREEILKLRVSDDKIEVLFRKGSKGKVRFKQPNDYGLGEQIRKDKIDLSNSQQYIEWQITYNIEISSGYKDSQWLVDRCVYKDLKGKERQAYELGRILYEMKKKGWITNSDLNIILREIEGYNDFLDSCEAYIERKGIKGFNGLEFEFHNLILPVFRLCNNDGTFIEALKQKQQMAYGMQIMVYFCIPCNILKEEDKNNLIYEITSANTDSIINLVKVFGCASKRHQDDILKILQCLLQDVNF